MKTERVCCVLVSTTANRYRVPKKQWVKWCLVARRVFNETYSAMVMNQALFLHPEQQGAKRAHWRTTAWNAAWTAADAVRGPQ